VFTPSGAFNGHKRMPDGAPTTFIGKLEALGKDLERKREVHKRRQSAVEEMWLQQSEVKSIESNILDARDYLNSLDGFSLRSLSLSLTGGREDERQRALALIAGLEEKKAQAAVEVDKRRQAIETLDTYIENLKSLEKEFSRIQALCGRLDAADPGGGWRQTPQAATLYDLEIERGELIEEIGRAHESIEYMMQAGAELDWALRCFGSAREMNFWGSRSRRWGGGIAEQAEEMERMDAQKHLDRAKSALAKSRVYMPRAFVQAQTNTFMMRADTVFDSGLLSMISHLQIRKSMQQITEAQDHLSDALKKLEDQVEIMIKRRNVLTEQRKELFKKMGIRPDDVPEETEHE